MARIYSVLQWAALAVLCSQWEAQRVAAQRDASCDDGQTVAADCDFELSEIENAFYCEESMVLALQQGCYRCVDGFTCNPPRGRRDPRDFVEEPALSAYNDDLGDVPVFEAVSTEEDELLSMPLNASVDEDSSVESTSSGSIDSEEVTAIASNDQNLIVAPHNVMAAAADAQASTASTQSTSRAKKPRTPVLYFVVPVLGTLSAFAIAARSRAAQSFERLDDEEEEINPFCDDARDAEDHDDGDDLEYAGRFSDEDVPPTPSTRA